MENVSDPLGSYSVLGVIFFPSSVEFWCPFPMLNYRRLAWETAQKQEVWWLESFD